MSNNDYLEVNDLKTLNKECENYFSELKTNKFPEIRADNISIPKYISQVKRPLEKQIGRYSGISFFEAINRIASDLVLWYGLEILINDVLQKQEIDKIALCLGNKNIQGQGDLLIHVKNGSDLNGEAFNTAESFFKQKLNYTLKKWSGKQLHYILCNSDDDCQERYETESVPGKFNGEDVMLIKVNLSKVMYDGNELRIPHFGQTQEQK